MPRDSRSILTLRGPARSEGWQAPLQEVERDVAQGNPPLIPTTLKLNLFPSSRDVLLAVLVLQSVADRDGLARFRHVDDPTMRCGASVSESR